MNHKDGIRAKTEQDYKTALREMRMRLARVEKRLDELEQIVGSKL